MQLGNPEAVKAGNERERRPVKPSPAKETASTERRAVTPEREPEPKPVALPKPGLSHYEEWEADLRRAIPGISDPAIANLKTQYYREP
jgi:hypothetical protein